MAIARKEFETINIPLEALWEVLLAHSQKIYFDSKFAKE